VRPNVYFFEDNGNSFSDAIVHLQSPLDRTVIIHYDNKSVLGEVIMNFGGRCEDNTGLQQILNSVGSESFARISVGVARPPDKEVHFDALPMSKYPLSVQEEWYLLNKFPPVEYDLVDIVLMPVIHKMMDRASTITETTNYFEHYKITYRELVSKFRSEIHYRLETGLLTTEKLKQRRLNPWTATEL